MINLKTYSIVFALSYLGFGISLLTIPNEFLSLFGCPLDDKGEMVARTFAASLLGGAVMHYLLRGANIQNHLVKIIFIGNIVFNSISAHVMAWATMQGIMNLLGFVPVSLNVFLAVFSILILLKHNKMAPDQ
jgi:hypothetical protein